MLIITRRRGEAVDLIDRDTDKVVATITVLAFLPNDIVRIGIEAPDFVRIVRDNAIDKGDRTNGNQSKAFNDNAPQGVPTRYYRPPLCGSLDWTHFARGERAPDDGTDDNA
jgi:sRNA-binding carbon storage regulator CsrA